MFNVFYHGSRFYTGEKCTVIITSYNNLLSNTLVVFHDFPGRMTARVSVLFEAQRDPGLANVRNPKYSLAESPVRCRLLRLSSTPAKKVTRILAPNVCSSIIFPNNIRSPLLRSHSPSLVRVFSTPLSVNYLLDSKSYCWVPRISPFSICFLDRDLSWRLSFAFTSAFPGFLLHPYRCTESGHVFSAVYRGRLPGKFRQSTQPV